MKKNKLFGYWLIAGALTLLVIITLAAFARVPVQRFNAGHLYQDTIPANKRSKVTRDDDRNAGDKRDLDKELRQLDNAREQLEKVKEHDWQRAQKDMEEALQKIDLEKIQQQATMAMQKAELEKIHAQMDVLKNIDFNKIQKEIEESMGDNEFVDKAKIKAQIDKAQKQLNEAMAKEDWKSHMQQVEKLNTEKMQLSMENAGRNLERAKEKMRNQKFDLGKSMEKARVDIDKAKGELMGYQEMIYAMEKDGLLDTHKDYTIEYDKGELKINGQKQPQEVVDKYKKYFTKDKITICKNAGHMLIGEKHNNKHFD